MPFEYLQVALAIDVHLDLSAMLHTVSTCRAKLQHTAHYIDNS